MAKKSDLILVFLILAIIAGTILIKPSITGYAVVEGTTARLHIYDETDSTTKYPNKDIIFYANFTNITSNESISGECNITFADSADNAMVYSSGLYAYTRQFTTNGNFSYNVTCANESYETLAAADSAFITARGNVCIGANYNFSCRETVNESCILNGSKIVNGTCFTIGANDVTIDCNGSTILGINTNSIGVYINYMINNSVIKNCIFKNNLTNPKTQTFFGVVGDNAPGNVTAYSNTFYNNTAGIYLNSFIIGADIYNNTFSGGESAMVIIGQYGLEYENITIHNNHAEKLNYSSGYPGHNGVVSFRMINNSLYIYDNFISCEWNPKNVEFYRVDNAEIFNNYFLGGTNHVNLWFPLSDYNHVYNNTFLNGTDGVAISGGSYNFFERNQFITQIHHPFAVFTYGGRNATNNIIFNNTMESPAYYGVIVSTMHDDGRFVTGTNISHNYFNNTRVAVYTGYIGYSDSGTIIDSNVINNSIECAINIPHSNTHHNTIINNFITSEYYYSDAICIKHSYENVVVNNTLFKNRFGITSSGYKNTIENNTIKNSTIGIYVSTSLSSVSGNILDSNWIGLRMEYCSDMILINNTISNSTTHNFELLSNDYSGFNYSIDTSNTINGKPIYYILDQNNVDYGPVNGSVLYIINSTNITISNFTSEKNKHSIFLWRTENSTIYDVNSFGSNIGIGFEYSLNNKVVDSNITNITGYSVYSSSGNSNITLINSTFRNMSISTSIIYVGWHLDVHTRNSTGFIENATVLGYNAGSLIFNETTNSSGGIPRKEIFQYYATGIGNILYSFPNYIINASYNNMKNSTSVSPAQNRDLLLFLRAPIYSPPGGSGGSGTSRGGGTAPLLLKERETKIEEPKEEEKPIVKEDPKEEIIPKEEIKPVEEIPKPEEKKKPALSAYVVLALVAGSLLLLAVLGRRKRKKEEPKPAEQPKEERLNIPAEQIKKKAEERIKTEKFRMDVNGLQKKIDEINNQLRKI